MTTLNSSNTLIEFLVQIGDTTVPAAQVLDLTLERSIDSSISYGTITFLDPLGLYSTLPINLDTGISLYLTDHNKINFNNSEYKIIEITQNKTEYENGTAVNLYFVDKLYYNASQAYISKGFKEKGIYDVVKALMGDIDIGLYELDLGSKDDYTWDTITTSKAINVIDTVKKLARDRGLLVFRSKLKYALKDITELTAEPVDAMLEYKDTTLMRDFQRIIKKNSKNNSLINNLVNLPEGKSFKYEIETKTTIPEDIKKEDIHADYKIESKLNMIVNEKSDQEKFFYNVHRDERGLKASYGNDLLDNVEMLITVNGTWEADAGKMCSIESINTDPDKPNDEFKPLAGKYLIHTCIDKITMGHFTQTLTLIRADEKE